MRTIKELLEVMLDNQHVFKFGLCKWVTDLFYHGNYISIKEYSALSQYILKNKPARVYSDFWWEPCDIAPRIKWIEEQIKKLEHENH